MGGLPVLSFLSYRSLYVKDCTHLHSIDVDMSCRVNNAQHTDGDMCFIHQVHNVSEMGLVEGGLPGVGTGFFPLEKNRVIR